MPGANHELKFSRVHFAIACVERRYLNYANELGWMSEDGVKQQQQDPRCQMSSSVLTCAINHKRLPRAYQLPDTRMMVNQRGNPKPAFLHLLLQAKKPRGELATEVQIKSLSIVFGLTNKVGKMRNFYIAHMIRNLAFQICVADRKLN